MADEKKEVLLRIRVDEEAAKKKIVDYQKEINATKAAQQELAKAIKLAGGATDEQTAQQVELKARLKDLTAQQNTQIKALERQKKADKDAEGSVNQLRAQLALLTDQYNALSEEERENTELGKQLEAQTLAISDKLRMEEQQIGDTRRQVGSYTKSILEAVDGTGLIATFTDKATQAKAAYTATLQLTRNAMAGNVSMLKLLRLGLAATGIGAVLLLLGGLVSWLTKTQEGIDWVNQKTKGFTTVLGVLTDYLSSIGKKVIDFVGSFEDLGDAAEKLGKLLLENLINRFKGLAVIIDGIINRDFTKIQDGVTQVGTGITDATAKAKAFTKELNEARKAGEAIEKENQRLRESERALNVERERANAQIEKYKMVAEDTTKSESVRADAARKAFALEEDLRGKQLKLQQDKIANMIAEQKLTNNLTADNDKLAEEQIKLAAIERDSIGKSIELQNKLNALRQEGAAKAREAAIKQLEAEAALLEVRTQNSLNSEEDILNLRIQMLDKRRQIELKAEGLTQAQVNAIKAKYLQEEANLREAFRNEQQAKEFEETERQSKAAFELSQKLLQRASERQELDLKQRRAKGLVSAQEYERQLETMKMMQLQRELMLLEQFAGKIAGQEEAIAAKRIEISNYLADKQIENQNRVEANAQAQAEAEADRLNRQAEETAAFVTNIGEMFASSLDQQGLDLQRFAQGVLMVTIDAIEKAVQAAAAEAILKATVSSMASPESVATAGTAGVVKAALLAGLIKGAFAIFKAQISKAVSSPPKGGFAEGGYTGSGYGAPDHSGYRVAGVVHEGEYVAPKWMVNQNPGLFQSLEQQRVRGYATGGYVQPPATRQWLGGQSMAGFDYNKLATAMRQVNIYTKVTDVKSGLAKDAATARIANQ
ncbi:hypothetical protein [Pontibacter sp. H249]|uniref:hypothetical protein n=1 Tax=Pontibacter sp. H249 TaxID=3133420 RepID=UPI0030BFC8BE